MYVCMYVCMYVSAACVRLLSRTIDTLNIDALVRRTTMRVTVNNERKQRERFADL